MDLLGTILNTQGGAAVQQIERQFGLQPGQGQSALSALLPALATGLQRNMSSQGGLESLTSALARGDHQRYLERPEALTDASTTEEGNGILGHVFGSKDVSRQVAQRASERTGIDAGTLKQILPLVATLAMAGLSRQAKAGGAVTPSSSAGLMGMLGPLLDQNRDGSMVDDIARFAGGILGGRTGRT